MTVLELIAQEVAAITIEQVLQAATALNEIEPKETVIGIIRSEHTHRLWALAHRYRYARESANLSESFQAHTEGERDALRVIAAKASAMEEVVRDLAWLEMRDEIGGEAWKDGSIGLRKDFTLIRALEEEGPELEFVGAGRLPPGLGTALLRAVRKKFGTAEEEEKEPEERKPQ